LEKYLAYSEDRAIVALFSGLIKKYRTDTEQRERDLVAERVRAAIEKSQLPARDFADRIGTSASRLSTYATGKVIPSAAMLMRIENYSKPSVLSTRHNHS
jgi:ribosome-binding protein aMBF1 (putative translation factor)